MYAGSCPGWELIAVRFRCFVMGHVWLTLLVSGGA